MYFGYDDYGSPVIISEEKFRILDGGSSDGVLIKTIDESPPGMWSVNRFYEVLMLSDETRAVVQIALSESIDITLVSSELSNLAFGESAAFEKGYLKDQYRGPNKLSPELTQKEKETALKETLRVSVVMELRPHGTCVLRTGPYESIVKPDHYKVIRLKATSFIQPKDYDSFLGASFSFAVVEGETEKAPELSPMADTGRENNSGKSGG